MDRQFNRENLRGKDKVAVQIVVDGDWWKNNFSSQGKNDSPGEENGAVERNATDTDTSRDHEDLIEGQVKDPDDPNRIEMIRDHIDHSSM